MITRKLYSIEIMTILTILGIVAAVVIPNIVLIKDEQDRRVAITQIHNLVQDWTGTKNLVITIDFLESEGRTHYIQADTFVKTLKEIPFQNKEGKTPQEVLSVISLWNPQREFHFNLSADGRAYTICTGEKAIEQIVQLYQKE